MPDDPDVQKRALRAELRERRQNMPASRARARDRRHHAHARASSSSDSAPSRSRATSRCRPSPDTRAFVNWAVARGIRVLLPGDARGRPARLGRRDGGRRDRSSLLGLPEPVGELLGPIAINDVDLIVIPAAAVDRTRHAAGLGPRLLRQDPRIDGEMPARLRRRLRQRIRRRRCRASVHDQPVNGVVTPTRHHRVLTGADHDPERPHAHLFLSLHRVRQRVRHPAGLHRRHPHRVPEVCGGRAAQGVQHRSA